MWHLTCDRWQVTGDRWQVTGHSCPWTLGQILPDITFSWKMAAEKAKIWIWVEDHQISPVLEDWRQYVKASWFRNDFSKHFLLMESCEVTGDRSQVNRWQVTGDRWQVTQKMFSSLQILWYRCYYPLTLKDSVSPVCRIFTELAPRRIQSSSHDVCLLCHRLLSWIWFPLVLYASICIFVHHCVSRYDTGLC